MKGMYVENIFIFKNKNIQMPIIQYYKYLLLFFSNFLTSASASYGACYTFNSELNPDDEHLDSRISSMTGPFFGLSLVLNLQQKGYLKGGITKQVSSHI